MSKKKKNRYATLRDRDRWMDRFGGVLSPIFCLSIIIIYNVSNIPFGSRKEYMALETRTTKNRNRQCADYNYKRDIMFRGAFGDARK